MFALFMKDQIKNLQRVWIHHTGMQLTTMSVLTASFAAVAIMFLVSINLKKIMVNWGESVQITAYLDDSLAESGVTDVRTVITKRPDVTTVNYVDKAQATQIFKQQMATYAPDLLKDSEFTQPFPASFQIGIKGGVQTQDDVDRVDKMAAEIRKIPGVEDVSYGQSWVKNYSSFINAFTASGWILISIILFGSLFVIGNSIRASVSSRRDEIEILELVGATPAMIRAPFIFEGVFMGTLTCALAMLVAYGVYLWIMQVMGSSLAFTRMTNLLGFVPTEVLLLFVVSSGALGGLGAYLTVRGINSGWAASRALGEE